MFPALFLFLDMIVKQEEVLLSSQREDIETSIHLSAGSEYLFYIFFCLCNHCERMSLMKSNYILKLMWPTSSATIRRARSLTCTGKFSK